MKLQNCNWGIRSSLILICTYWLTFPSFLTQSYHSGAVFQVQAFDLALPLSAIDTFYRTSPYASAFLTCGVKASLADIVAHSGQQKKSEPRPILRELRMKLLSNSTPHENKKLAWWQKQEVRRNLAYILYGGLYQGMAQEYIYNRIFPLLFGEDKGLWTLTKKILFDQAIIAPFLCLPLMYIIKGMIFKQSLLKSMFYYVHDVANKRLLESFWLLWVPVKIIKFTVIPEHYRITFMAIISFFWLIIFSSISEQKK